MNKQILEYFSIFNLPLLWLIPRPLPICAETYTYWWPLPHHSRVIFFCFYSLTGYLIHLFQVNFLGFFKSFIHSSNVSSNFEKMSSITANCFCRLFSDSNCVLNLKIKESSCFFFNKFFFNIPGQSSLLECRA